jgi:Bacteriophage clamp loader A subunit
MTAPDLGQWLTSINFSKENLIGEIPENISSYTPYIINKCVAGHLDTILFANELNQYPYISKDMQYAFYLHSLRKKKRYTPWVKKEDAENLTAIKEYYDYNDKRALEALRLLNREEINFIKQRLNKGGMRK